MTTLLLSLLLWLCPLSGWAGSLAAQGAFVLDQNGAQRLTFSSNERVVLRQQVFNSVASGGRITFRFFLVSPSGAEVFRHAGNAVPGSVGNAASQVSGVPVAQFYSSPGIYTFRGEAELDGVVTTQQAQFSVSSPNILLIYPPNGARDVADNPLTFRWSASGASRYRVTVGDNPSMYNSIFNQDSAGAESFLEYPQNPSEPRQRLTSGQVYYWIVEGLDSAGNVIAKTETPFSYSVRATALAKDLAVSDFTLEGPVGQDGAVKLQVMITNRGNTSENSVALRIGVGGLPAQGTPLAVTFLNPGETREFTVQGMIPVDQKQTLATACLELFDDNVPNNCKTFSVTRPEAPTGGPVPVGGSLLSPDQMWGMLGELLKERGIDLNEYSMGSIPPAELAALLDGLRQGTVEATVTSGPATTTTTGSQAPTGPIATVKDTPKTIPIFGEAPELQTEPEGDKEPKQSAEQAWQDIGTELKKLGIDLAEYKLPENITADELAALIKGLKDGSVKAEITGTGPGPATAGTGGAIRPPDLSPPETKKPPVFETAPDLLPPPEETKEEKPAEEEGSGREWTGMAGPAGKEPFTFTVHDGDDWVKRWKRLRDGKVPSIDFNKNIVVCIVAGAADRAERVEILNVQVGTSGLVVRYKIVVEGKSGEQDKVRTRVPWVLRQVKASPGLEVRFERAVEGGEQ